MPLSRRILKTLENQLLTEVERLPLSSGGRQSILVAYPNEYAVGMANLGLHALIEQAYQLGGAVDRAFLPAPTLLTEHRRSRTPIWGISSKRPACLFDAILFSIAFEPDYVGFLQMLNLSGIPLLAEHRPDSAPLIIVGGMAPTLNPEPLALFCDLVGIGESESLLPPLLTLLAERLPRWETLERASRLPGWYVPSLGKPDIVRQWGTLTRPTYPVVISKETAFSGHVDVEISRGCRWRCRFCAAGHVITPYRELSLEALQEAFAWGLAQRGVIGLVGTDVSDHSQLEPIVEHIWSEGGEVALPSLRVESLAAAEHNFAARLIRQRPPRTLTMAIESAKEDLRNALGKRIPQEHIFRAAQLAKEAGVQYLKVYLLVGLPGECWDDIEQMVPLARELAELGPPGGLTLSVNGFVPKPGTPLQGEPAPDHAYLKRIRHFLRQALPKEKIHLDFESPDWTRWQALLSLGGQEVSEYILQAANENWRRALSQAAQTVDILQGRSRKPDEKLPWHHIHHRQNQGS